MNSYERMTRRLRGDAVDRPPNFNIMMTFAAHHVGRPLSRYYLDHRVLCEANLAVLQDFDLDIVQAISDPYREAADFGADVVFPEDNLPLCRAPLLVDPADLSKLKPPDPATGRRMSDRLAGVRDLREQVGGEVPVMGWVEGALAEAADLRGDSALLMDLYDRPDYVHDLLEVCVEVAIAFARARSRPAPTSSAWATPLPHRFRPTCIGSSRCPTSSVSSPPSTTWAPCAGCTSAATRPTSWN